jgi:hypothetical protein
MPCASFGGSRAAALIWIKPPSRSLELFLARERHVREADSKPGRTFFSKKGSMSK